MATVLSTTSGTPWRCATLASASMSQTLPAGLPIVSANTALVFSSISLSIASGLVALGEAPGDALARQDVAEQRVRGAVELRNGDDVAAGVGEIDEGEMQRGLAGRDRERADAAFEFGDALFENRGGRVGDPAVAIAFGLEVEQRGAVIGAVEGVSDGLVDRNRDGLGGRIGFVAGVNCNRFVAHRPPLRFAYRTSTMRFIRKRLC